MSINNYVIFSSRVSWPEGIANFSDKVFCILSFEPLQYDGINDLLGSAHTLPHAIEYHETDRKTHSSTLPCVPLRSHHLIERV